MEAKNRAVLVVGAMFMLLGVGLLAFNLFPGLGRVPVWPMIFFMLAAAFFLPPFLAPLARRGLAALLIPGSILLTLGLIFTYNVLTHDWGMWAYGWILINAGVGAGLALAAWVGDWGRGARTTGLWMLVIGLVAFGIFAAIFGDFLLRILGPLMLLAGGIWLLLRRR